MQTTGLKNSLELLSRLSDVPFGDEHELVRRAGGISAIWEGVV
jgi:hypothetical protein